MSEDEDRDDTEAETVPLSDLKEEVVADEREEIDSQAGERVESTGQP